MGFLICTVETRSFKRVRLAELPVTLPYVLIGIRYTSLGRDLHGIRKKIGLFTMSDQALLIL